MFLTVKLKLRSPSQRKLQALDNLIIEYNSLYSELLKEVIPNLDYYRENGIYNIVDKETGEVKKTKFSEMSLRKALPDIKDIQANIPALYKESALKDIASGFSSYFELERIYKTDLENEKENIYEPGLPTLPDINDNYRKEAILEIGNCGTDLDLETYWRNELLKNKSGKFRPIPIIRARDLALLVRDEKLYLFLKILNDKSGQPVEGFFDLAQKKEFNYRGKAGLLFPLEIGKNGWQWTKFIEPLIEDNVDLKSGRLVKQDDYYLELAIDFPEAKQISPQTFLGIDLGENVSAAYAIVDETGIILERGHVSDELRQIRKKAGFNVKERQQKGKKVNKRHWNQKTIDGAAHSIINKILALAEKHQSQIVLEDLDGNFRVKGKFTKSCYQKIGNFIGYKAKIKGIPVRTVWAAYTSKICINCGSLNTNRSKDRLSIDCLDCGHKDHADEAAAVNIARRALYRKNEWKGGWKGGWKEFYCSFANKDDSETNHHLRNKLEKTLLELA